VRVLRVYHVGGAPDQRARERALLEAGVEPTLVAPRTWPAAEDRDTAVEAFRVVKLDVVRPGDVNRHAYAEPRALRRVIREFAPDVLDIHEEPFSVAARQWLAAAPPNLPIVMYTAQNVDKRLPPPFLGYERRAHRRLAALYPCSRQAAAVARGKGFDGLIEVLPLGFDPELFFPGTQSFDDDELTLAFFGRLVPEKGVRDAVRVLAATNAVRPARLLVVGMGPEDGAARELATALGVGDRLEIFPWQTAADVAMLNRQAHAVLVPSTPTTTWTEQFGRVIVEAQASGAVVAGYATGSIPEVGGDAAALVTGSDVAALSAAVGRIVSDGAEYAARRERGFTAVADRTWQEVASRQLRLYERAHEGCERMLLPRSPRGRRAVARSEFGPTALTTAGSRPFALPVLRSGGRIPEALGAAVDAVAEAWAIVRRQRPASTPA
jgi:glycosyltransferase involved in cell wall biosynthesis